MSARPAIILFIAAWLMPTLAAAADKPNEFPASANGSTEAISDIDLFTLEVPTVVTASRHEQRVSSLPYAVSVITAEDIRHAGARNVPDALRLVPGVEVADLAVNNNAVSIRGFNDILGRSILVLVDGRQIFDSLFGGILWGNWPFQLEDIERIEVIRGPGGVIWGANAVNGVINVITKDPKDQLGLTVTGGGGSQGWNKEHAGYAFQDGKLRMRVSGEFESSDGFPKGGSILGPPNDDLKAGKGQVKAIFDATRNDTITLSGGSAVTDGGFPMTPLATGLTRKNTPRSQGSFIQGNWEHRIAADNRIELNGYVNDFHASPGTKQLDYRYEQFALQLTHTFNAADDHTLTWGIDGRSDILDAGNSDPSMLSRGFLSTGTIGLYAQDEWRFAPRWTFTLGGRIDYEFYGGFQPSARAALSYELTENSAVYGSVSRAFQMPPIGLRFLETSFIEGLAYFTGDQNMRPEKLIAYELGYRGTFKNRLHVNANLFCHQYRDLTVFDLETGPPGLIRYNIENGYSAITYGLEADARYVVNKQLTLLGNYTFETINESGAYSLANTDRISPPRHRFMIGTRYSPLDRLYLSAHLYFVDDVEAPNPIFPLIRRNMAEYFRLDLRAEYEFWKDQASVAVGIRNLLDKSHPEGSTLFQNVAEAPRMIYAEAKFRFR